MLTQHPGWNTGWYSKELENLDMSLRGWFKKGLSIHAVQYYLILSDTENDNTDIYQFTWKQVNPGLTGLEAYTI